MASKRGQKRQEVVLQIPELGLNPTQIRSLKQAFKNELVSTLGEKSAVQTVVIIRIRVVRQIAQV
ncbi:MAG TPA: hypothetical protein VNJ70_09325 [Thermoanaerobaculia bacterium]|nr:hypothetical protein [Thermoanaerobaculia bacterium]